MESSTTSAVSKTRATNMPNPFANGFLFKTCVHQVFKKVDKDKSGTIDKDELTIAMCHLHYKLAKKSPGVTDPPTSQKVDEMLREFDTDNSGTLTEDEFLAFAGKWFNRNGAVFARRLIVTSFISMVVLPETAAIVHREVPLARQIPKAAFKVLFGVILKLVATRLPART